MSSTPIKRAAIYKAGPAEKVLDVAAHDRGIVVRRCSDARLPVTDTAVAIEHPLRQLLLERVFGNLRLIELDPKSR